MKYHFQLFEEFTESKENSSLEKEAKFFFNCLESLMTPEMTSDVAIEALRESMSTLSPEKKKAFKNTETFLDYTNRFVDFFKISF